MTREQQNVLEAIIDRTSLREVTEAISTICTEKGLHITENWQDRVTAAPWFRAAAMFDKLSERLKFSMLFEREKSARQV